MLVDEGDVGEYERHGPDSDLFFGRPEVVCLRGDLKHVVHARVEVGDVNRRVFARNRPHPDILAVAEWVPLKPTKKSRVLSWLFMTWRHTASNMMTLIKENNLSTQFHKIRTVKTRQKGLPNNSGPMLSKLACVYLFLFAGERHQELHRLLSC